MDLLCETCIRPKRPYDFELSSSIFSRLGTGVHTAFQGGRLYKCYEEDGSPLLLEVESSGDLLAARLWGSGSVTPPDAVASWITSAELDLAPFYKMADGIMAPIVKKLYGLKPPRTRTVFEALIIAFIEQQIGLRVAHVLQDRLVRRYGTPVSYGGMTFYAFPSPETLAALGPQDIREVGLSSNKAMAIVELAYKVSKGGLNLEALKSMDVGRARESLLDLRGVGEWTADYALVRGAGKLSVAPYDDLGLRDAVGQFHLGGRRATRREAEQALSRFPGYAGLAAYYLLLAKHSTADRTLPR